MNEDDRTWLTTALQGVEDRTAALILAEVSTLRTETQRGFEHLDRTLESIDSRLRLQAGLIQAGARAMARFSEYSESSEQRWVELVHRVETLEKRLESK
jgi:predicted amidophosphoribosyltransferase